MAVTVTPFDLELSDAFELLANHNVEAFTPKENETPHVFSAQFEARMKKLIRLERKPYYRFISSTARKTALVAAALMIMITTSLMSVGATREPIVRFIIDTFTQFSIVTTEPTSKAPLHITNRMELAFVPDGFQRTVLVDTPSIFSIQYRSQADNVVYTQQVMSAKLHINTEGTTLESITINDNDAIIYYNIGHYGILWSDGMYVYQLIGTVDKEAIIEMAESVT